MLLRESTPALNLSFCYFSGFQGFRELMFEGFQWLQGYTLVEEFNILDILKDCQGFKCFEGFKGFERFERSNTFAGFYSCFEFATLLLFRVSRVSSV